MSILTKNALSASNQASFPDNTTGAITPQILRNFNQDVIDTLVDSLNTGSYAITTGSNDFTQANSFTSISASSFISASAFTGDGSRLTNITASVALPISDEGILLGYATQLNFSGSNISASLQAGVATISVNTNNLITTSSFNSFTASVNSFTASQVTKDSTLATYTASVDTKFTAVGASTASLNAYTSSNDTKWSTLSTQTSSNSASLNQLNQFTASQNTKDITLASYTGSNDTKWSSLGTQSGSWVTETESGSFLITASVSLNTITFTKGNNTTFAITVNTGSGGGGTTDISALNASTASLNAFSASQITKDSTLAIYTASVDASSSMVNTKFTTLASYTASLNAFTASQETKNTTLASYTASVDTKFTSVGASTSSLNTATASLFTSASLSLTTASFSGNTLTFRKGDGTTFGLIIPDVSGSGTPAGTISGSAQITALGFVSSSVTASSLITASVSGQLLTFTKGNSNQFTLNLPTGSATYVTGSYGAFSDYTTQSGSANTAYAMKFNTTDVSDNVILSGSTGLKVGTYGTYNLQWSGQLNEGAGGETTSVWLRINGVDVSGSRGDVTVASNTSSLPSWNYFLTLNQNDVVEIYWSSTGANTTWAFSPAGVTPTRPSTASLIATLARVDVGGGSNSVSTGSFNSFTSSINAFTASQETKNATLGALTGSFATTGSNVFTGIQTFRDAALNATSLVSVSGSLMLVAKSYTSASAHLSASTSTQINLIFKNNDNTADTIISGSNNLFTNPLAPTAGFKRYIGGGGNITLLPGNTPQISGSMGFSPAMSGNYFGGNSTTITMRGPLSSSAWTINANNILGTLNIGSSAALNAEKLTAGLTMTGNSIAGTLSIVANQSAFTSSTTTISNNNINGVVTLNLSSSALTFTGNTINDTAFTLTNQFSSSSVGLGILSINQNTIGGNANAFLATGSQLTGSVNFGIPFNQNFVFGNTNTLFANASDARVSGSNAYHGALATGLMGTRLIVSGSSNGNDTNSFGSVFVGRWNADDSRRNKTSDVVFAVGTGNSTTRKTGFLIDSGSNTFIEGTLNVSGSTAISGTFELTGSAYGNVVSMSVNSNTASMDLSLGNYFELTASVSPVRIEVSNLKGGLTSTLAMNGVTASTINWSSNVLQPSGSAYTASVSGSNDILSFVAFNSSRVNVVSTLKMI